MNIPGDKMPSPGDGILSPGDNCHLLLMEKRWHFDGHLLEKREVSGTKILRQDHDPPVPRGKILSFMYIFFWSRASL